MFLTASLSKNSAENVPKQNRIAKVKLTQRERNAKAMAKEQHHNNHFVTYVSTWGTRD